MSRFASAQPTARLDLGPCQCPGAPHESDWVVHRTRLGYGPLGDWSALAVEQGVPRAKRKLLSLAIVDWNFLGADGTAAAIDEAAIDDLDVITAETIYAALDGSVLNTDALPNGSGAPSVATSRASASRPPKTTRTPTTR